MDASTDMWTHAYTYIYINACAHMHTHTYTLAQTHTHSYSNMHAGTQTQTRIQAHMHAHTHTHTCTHTQVYTKTLTWPLWDSLPGRQPKPPSKFIQLSTKSTALSMLMASSRFCNTANRFNRQARKNWIWSTNTWDPCGFATHTWHLSFESLTWHTSIYMHKHTKMILWKWNIYTHILYNSNNNNNEEL